MSCKKCGEQYVSGLCKFCAREKARDGDWKDALGHHDTTEDGESDD